MFEPSWLWVATRTEQLKISEINLGKEFLNLVPDTYFFSLCSSRLGSENRLMDEAIVSASCHLGEEATLDWARG